MEIAQRPDGRVRVALPPLADDCTIRLPDGRTRYVRASMESQEVLLP